MALSSWHFKDTNLKHAPKTFKANHTTKRRNVTQEHVDKFKGFMNEGYSIQNSARKADISLYHAYGLVACDVELQKLNATNKQKGFKK